MMNVVNSKGEKQSFGVEEEYAKRCIQLLLRNLITLTQNLSPLPENKNRYITMKLFYTDATPQDYQPPMFRDCTMEKPFTFAVDPENTNFYKQTAGSIDTGFHAITLKITSIADAVSECKSFEEYQDKQIKTLSAEEDISEKESLKDSLKENNIIILDSQKKHQSCPELLPSLPQNNISKQSLKYVDERYEKEDAAIKEMLTTHTQDSGLEATQPLESNFSQITQNVSYVHSKPSFEYEAKVKYEKTREKNSKKLEVKKIVSVGENLSKLTLNFRKAFELNEEKKRLLCLRNTVKGSVKDIDVIRCECGDVSEDSGDMIQCYVCQSWVHAWCYGFISGNDERLPDDHSCYSCLLRKFEPVLYESMKDLALFRRALMIIWEEGLPESNSEFSNRLGCSRQNACQILKRLLQEGFIANITQNRASRTNTSKKNGRINMNDEMVVVKNAENKQRLFSEYFQPLLKISHHYEKQENVNTSFQKDKSVNSNASIDNSIPINALSITNSSGVDSLKDPNFIINATPLSELKDANIPKELCIKEINDINHNNAELDTTDDEDLSAQNIIKKPHLTESTNLINSNAGFGLQKHNTINNFKTYAISNINQIPKKNNKRTRLHFSDENFDTEAKKRKSSVILKPILV
ncbi:hypothetical protein PNEG_01729 [Pneumocystis murina B123]|uniref:HORMA domain-containing protein n=1 Tax=Pneumocystis murina (strain B123) TaxID=1069680 RepID=M7P7X0_PNEMU|nr:hypothetical protein PNEG_01729 [Pneumocystis murina B123]EMR09970.1 hypothetical protein PNEG_01729 [Pneumocystis murina B123]